MSGPYTSSNPPSNPELPIRRGSDEDPGRVISSSKPSPSLNLAQAFSVPEAHTDDVAVPEGGARRVRTRAAHRARGRASHPVSDRYRILTEIGKGGAGVVYKARDRALNRELALKTLRTELAQDRNMLDRFVHEAQVVAQLAHPAIVPVHDLGQLPDGRWFITMMEIRGSTFREAISRLHKARAGGPFVPTADGWTLRRTIEAFRTVCEAVAFAHRHGVIHRDLKPDNVMVGDFGEVHVLDWGLALVLDSDDDGVGDPLESIETGAWEMDKTTTRHGVVVGTPAYMPPEQARADREAMGPWSDVWALGAVLYAILYGRPPYRGSADEVLETVQKRSPKVPRSKRITTVPEELVEVWQRCTRMEPADRYPDARAVAQAVGAWLEGSRARDRAMKLVQEAHTILAQHAEAKERADRARERARAALVSLRSSDDLSTKEKAWALEDTAREARDEVNTLLADISTKCRMAMAQVPELPEARKILADLYRQRAEDAEIDGDTDAAREYRALLAAYDDGTHADYLTSDAELTFTTVPDGARVRVRPYESRARRLQLGEPIDLGTTPVEAHRLPTGSYIVETATQNHTVVRYPVHLTRGRGWVPVPPGQVHPAPVHLPPKRALFPFERYVPAGWFSSGGDPKAPGSLPRQRTWVDDFAIASRPVCHAEYVAYLNDLVHRGATDAAEARVPQLPALGQKGPPTRLYGWDIRNRVWMLPKRGSGLAIDPQSPVVGVSWQDANAYCRWLALRSGKPFRLPGELEWEKAARGVDGRPFPWGHHADPAFHCMQDSHLDEPGPPPTTSFSVDDSPFGVLGMAGGVMDWCADAFVPHGPKRRGSRAVAPAPPTTEDTQTRPGSPRRVVRGGAWNLDSDACRSAARSALAGSRKVHHVGFRVARTLSADDLGLKQ